MNNGINKFEDRKNHAILSSLEQLQIYYAVFSIAQSLLINFLAQNSFSLITGENEVILLTIQLQASYQQDKHIILILLDYNIQSLNFQGLMVPYSSFFFMFQKCYFLLQKSLILIQLSNNKLKFIVLFIQIVNLVTQQVNNFAQFILKIQRPHFFNRLNATLQQMPLLTSLWNMISSIGDRFQINLFEPTNIEQIFEQLLIFINSQQQQTGISFTDVNQLKTFVNQAYQLKLRMMSNNNNLPTQSPNSDTNNNVNSSNNNTISNSKSSTQYSSHKDLNPRPQQLSDHHNSEWIQGTCTVVDKCLSRAADVPDPSKIRTPETLYKAVKLVEEMIQQNRQFLTPKGSNMQFSDFYTFELIPRLRALRYDFQIQNIYNLTYGKALLLDLEVAGRTLDDREFFTIYPEMIKIYKICGILNISKILWFNAAFSFIFSRPFDEQEIYLYDKQDMIDSNQDFINLLDIIEDINTNQQINLEPLDNLQKYIAQMVNQIIQNSQK